VRTLAELGRNAAARAAADAIDRDVGALPEARAAAAEARALVERPTPETSAELVAAALAAKAQGRGPEAERAFERAAALLEVEAGGALVADVPDGYGAASGLPWAANGVNAGHDARSGPPPLAFSPDGRRLALADGARVSLVELDGLREIATLRGHGAEVSALAWSSDGAQLASGALDESARVWAVPSGKVVQTLRLGGAAGGVWFAKQNGALACVIGREITGWDLAKGTVFARFGASRGDQVLDPSAVAPNGLVSFARAEGGAEIYSLLDRERVQGLGAPDAVAIAPDGARIAVAEERALRLFTAPRIAVERAIDDAGSARRLVFSADGALLAADDRQGTVRVWDARRGTLLRAHASGGAEVLAVTADGRLLLRGPRAIRVLDARSGTEVRVASFGEGRTPRAASPDGKVLVGSARTSVEGFELWDAATGQSLGVIGEPHAAAPDAVAISPDAATLAIAVGGRARLVGLRTGDVTALERGAGDVTRLRWVDGGAKLLGFGERTVALWDVKTGRLTRDVDEEKGARRVLAVDARGDVAAVEDWEGFLWSWDLATDQSIHRLGPGPRPCDVGFAFSPDRKVFACAKEDGAVRTWSPDTGAPLATFGKGQGTPRQVAFLADGKTLAVGLDGGTIAFFDAATGAPARAPIDTSFDGISLLVPARGKLFALGHGKTEGGAVRLYALEGHVPPRSWPNRLEGVTDASLSPDGQVLAVAGARQRGVGLWRVADAEPLAMLRVLDEGAAAVAMTPDGWIEVFGDPAVLEGRAVCRLGARTLPFALCRDRFVTRGLVRGLLANHRAWREP
jgi:WD40 repeat protein